MSRLRQLAKRLRVGRLAYRLVHAPRAFLKKCAREGPLNLWLARRGRAAMERAALRLPPAPEPLGADVPCVYFLTGAQFWYQTAFCGHSLRVRAGAPVRIVVIDDGTLRAEHAAALARVLPGLEVRPADAVVRRLDEHLPASKYPTLRRRRLVYPHLRKLTDVHAGGTGWKLVLDSDMLFFRRPDVLLRWLAAPDRPCHMRDVESAYGYSPALMAELAGAPVPDRVNVGVCGLRSDGIDWDRLEHWCRALAEREGDHYLQEQALTAMLVAGTRCVEAPAAEYVVRPARPEAERPTAALHHYVAESKAWYFRFGWRRANTNRGEV
ncbi:glycosyl transferase [Gemmata sp. JC673]|uniref:Glycosyl transferase n=1 Tax=Gemmata algarum TaxID=2975278 RepID=A0ABU5EW51_9BACT|nr:glycosyl transferase [Gemmata algarum]MDY3557849.1 glycosyl transferase [Gemmata algarum]